MHVTVRNLGPIKEAEIDLKPLTIFVGPNNSGKTWLAYTLAGIFGSFGRRAYLEAYLAGDVPKIYPRLEEAIDNIINRGTTTINLTQFASEYNESYFNQVASLSPIWMHEFMSTRYVSFRDLAVQIRLAEAKKAIISRIINVTLRRNIATTQKGFSSAPLLRLHKEQGKEELTVYTVSDDQITTTLSREIIEECLVREIFSMVQQSLYPDAVVLPSERAAYTLFSSNNFNSFLVLPIQERELVDRYFPKSTLRPLIQPVADQLAQTLAIAHFDQGQEIKRELDAKKDASIQRYILLARLLETTILGGEIAFTQAGPGLIREMYFKPDDTTWIDMPISSSMVKELAPLVIYLRYVAQSGELLVIDEPEMNLHLEAQVRLIEFLAMLIRAGLHIIMTTHSPYFADHLCNLMKASKREDKEPVRNEFYLRETDAFISQEEVSVYLIDHGSITNILDEDGITHLDNFGQVADRLSDIFFAI